MTSYAFYILIAFSYPLLYGFVNIIEGQLSNNTIKHPVSILFYMTLTNVVFLPLILFFGMPTFPSLFLLTCYFILAMLDQVYQIPYYIALKKIDTSIVGALFSLGRVGIPILTYFFLDERLELTQYIGFILIILSSIALSIKSFKLPKLNIAFFLMLLSSSLRSVFAVLEKYTIDTDGNWINMVIYPALFSYILAFGLLIIPNWRKDITGQFSNYKNKFGFFISVEIFAFIASSIMFFVLPHISAVTKTSISATMPIFILLTGVVAYRFFNIKLNENLDKNEITKKLLLFSIMVLGVYLLVR